MSGRKRVLVVDDHPINRKVAMLHLRDSKWDAAQASDGMEALATLRAGAFDCVLLDMSMPGMSGPEVCREIRSDERLRNLPVVGYTAHSLREEIAQIRKAGFDEVLIKPISRDRLLEALNDAVANHH